MKSGLMHQLAICLVASKHAKIFLGVKFVAFLIIMLGLSGCAKDVASRASLVKAVNNADEIQVFVKEQQEKLTLQKSFKEGEPEFKAIKEAVSSEIKYNKTRRDAVRSIPTHKIAFLKNKEKLCEFSYNPDDGRVNYDDISTGTHLFFFLPEEIMELIE